jgi:transposase
MNIRYRVELNEGERAQLTAMLSGGKHASRKLKRAQILLAAAAGIGDEAIADSISVGGSTVYRTKRRFVEGNLDLALSEEARPGAARKLSGKETALLVATVCSSPPEGRKRWTLDLLAGQMVQLTEHEGLSRETVRRRLAEDDLKPWLRKMWCIPEVNGTYVARMEDVLDLYAEEADPRRPVVCFDESPTQLIGEVREPIPAEPGQPERYDCEYKRNGTANLFVFLDAHKSWRHVKVTDQRTARDFAECMRDLADIHYPDADRIRVVMDNLSLTRREPCTKPSRHPRHTAFFSAWNFIIRRNMRAGSTWLKSRSAYCAVNVWIAELASVKSSSPRSTRGIGDATSLFTLYRLISDRQRVQRVMLAATGAEAVAEVQEVFLPDGVQHLDQRALDDLVLQRRDAQWALPSVGLRDEDPA